MLIVLISLFFLLKEKQRQKERGTRNKKKVFSFHCRNFNFFRNKSYHFYHLKSKLKEKL